VSNPVAALKASADEIKKALETGGHLSLLVTAEDVLRRNLLIAAASYFEYELGQRIDRVFSGQGCTEECISIIRNKAISRQFYSYFDFKVANTNRLFAAFGVPCKDRAVGAIKDSTELKEAQQAFLEICSLRNNMVHENFAAFSMDISTDDVYAKFEKGVLFLDFFERVISGGS
jgi:hypothetical protein